MRTALLLLASAAMWAQTGPRVIAGDRADSAWSACTKHDIANQFKGGVTLRLVVDRTGKAHDVKVVKKLRDDLDRDAVEQVKKWRFQPAMKSGKPAAVRIQLEINYDCTTVPKSPSAR
jgi:TonB family protein